MHSIATSACDMFHTSALPIHQAVSSRISPCQTHTPPTGPEPKKFRKSVLLCITRSYVKVLRSYIIPGEMRLPHRRMGPCPPKSAFPEAMSRCVCMLVAKGVVGFYGRVRFYSRRLLALLQLRCMAACDEIRGASEYFCADQ